VAHVTEWSQLELTLRYQEFSDLVWESKRFAREEQAAVEDFVRVLTPLMSRDDVSLATKKDEVEFYMTVRTLLSYFRARSDDLRD